MLISNIVVNSLSDNVYQLDNGYPCKSPSSFGVGEVGERGEGVKAGGGNKCCKSP